MSDPEIVHVSGSCLCGALSYAGDTAILRAVNCHCADCRTLTGAAFATILFVKKDDLSITGPLKSFQHKADSGNTLTKTFCPTCGSQMFSENEMRVGLIGLRAGSLDQPDLVKPGENIFCDSALPSTAMDPELPRAARMPG